MKKFSIIFPTRDRMKLCIALIKSITENTYDLNGIEVLVAVDTDDEASQRLFEAFMKDAPWLKMFVVERSLSFSKDYYNFLYKQSCGEYIIAINDDCEFQTPCWDRTAYNVLKDYPGVVYGKIEDGLDGFRAPGHGDYRCFPLQGRKGVEALGYFFPDRIPTWGADIWVQNLYNQVDSIVEIPIMIMHIAHHNHKRERDEINKRIGENQVAFSPAPTYHEINTLLGALNGQEANIKK